MRIGALPSSGDQPARGEIESPPPLAERFARIDWTFWGIVAFGALLRFLFLSMKPPHFDEGINGWFVDQMMKTGFYRYDPTNYHGPLHFYILFLSQALFGRHIWALRLPVVLASIGSIFVTLKFEPFVGRTVSRIAALAMAISPAFIFYGRYSIHEVWLLLFSMLFVLGLLGLWRLGTRGYLWCVGIGIAGMILTKETYIIHIGSALIAAGVLWVSHRLIPMSDVKRARQQWDLADLAMVTGTAIFFIAFFYSGTFLNWPGLKGLYLTFATWYQTGSNGNGHEKPWPYWLELVMRYEWPVFIGLVLCLACQFFRNFVIRYLAIYGVGIFAAYSIIHYKTPWIIISIVWPLLFVFAAGAAATKIPRKAFYMVGLALIGFAFGALVSYLIQPEAVRTACSWGCLLARSRQRYSRGDLHQFRLRRHWLAPVRVGACFRFPWRRVGFPTRKVLQTQRWRDARRSTKRGLRISPHVAWDGGLVELLPLQHLWRALRLCSDLQRYL